MTRTYCTRRTLLATTSIVAAAGCLGTDDEPTDEKDPNSDDESEENIEFDNEQSGSIEVADQEKHGERLDINSATANVEYYLRVEYDGTTIESEPVPADETVSPELSLSPPIENDTSITIEVRAADDDTVLDSTTIEYSIALPEPELTVQEAQALAEDRTGYTFERWIEHEEPFIVTADTDGYIVEMNYLSSRKWSGVRFSSEERTEAAIARLNAHFLEQFFESKYPVNEVTIHAWLVSDIDESGNESYDIANTTRMTAETAAEINWENFIYELDPWENLPNVADEYTWQWYEDPTE